MANQLPSGKWRGRIRHPRTGKQTSPHTIIGGSKTYGTQREAERAEDQARDALLGSAERGVTVREFWTEWTTSPLWARPSESTNVHNKERTKAFAERYGDRPIATIDAKIVAEWLQGGANVGTVDKLRTMFNDARRPQAGMLVDRNPWAGLRLQRSNGRKDIQPPDQATVARMIAAADELTPPSFAAYLLTACWSAARPGELDALRWTDLDFTPGAECIRIERQWSVKVRKLTPPKHGKRRTIAMTDPVRERLLDLPRESEWVFTTLRGYHYTPSTRNHHWNRVRCSVGLGDTHLYLTTRHWFGWYALNVLELPDHVIAAQFGHRDGGRLIRELYGHPDAAIARQRIREAFREVAPVAALVTRAPAAA
jgi:integrase